MCGDNKDNNCDKKVDDQDAKGCVKYYKDGGGGGFGSGAPLCLCKPEGDLKVTKGGDCYDTSADPASKNVFTGQTKWFTSPRKDKSFDYNCDKKETKQYAAGGACSGFFFFCNTKQGFEKEVACGAKGKYVTGCSGFSCGKQTQDRTQGCR